MQGVVLLGAGYSRRFGADKRIAQFGSTSVARKTIEAYLTAFSEVRLVIRDDDAVLHRHVEDLPIAVVTTDEAALGMGHSLRRGFTDLAWDFAFVGLLDMPFIQTNTLLQLQAAAREHKQLRIIRPRLNTETDSSPPWGHPIGFPRHLFGEFSTLSGDQGARDILRAHAADIVEFDTEDDGVVQDIDRPSDIILN